MISLDITKQEGPDGHVFYTGILRVENMSFTVVRFDTLQINSELLYDLIEEGSKHNDPGNTQ